jgi:hypothetical protein
MRHATSERFEQRLLGELRELVIERRRTGPSAGTPSGRRLRWARRVAVTTGLAATFAVVIVAVVPTMGRDRGGPVSAAYAVTEGEDGVVTVEIRSIEDAQGLESAIEATGVPASVHYLPAGTVCSVPKDRLADLVPVGSGPDRPHVAIGESEEGAFTFSFDTSLFSPGDSIVIDAQYAAPEHGQPGDQVASIAARVLHGDFDQCDLADGTISGWTFQDGATPGDKP